MDAPPRTSRAAARERTMARILELGREQLVERGPAELSVREIARGLGMVSSAIYRYVPSRDALLTLLIADAFTELADAVDAAVGGAGPDPRARFLALAGAMADWALAHPERWTLLYGTPVRGYTAPAETTTAPGTRVMAHVLRIAADAAAQGRLPERPLAPLPAEVAALLREAAEELHVPVDPAAATAAVTAWSALVGILSGHVFGQLGPDAVALGRSLVALQAEIAADLICPRRSDQPLPGGSVPGGSTCPCWTRPLVDLVGPGLSDPDPAVRRRGDSRAAGGEDHGGPDPGEG